MNSSRSFGIYTFLAIARFQRAEQLVAVTQALKVGGWKQWETFSPHPIDRVECRANRNFISASALAGGIFGFAASLAMQVIPTAILYPISMGGRPVLSLPALFPITFECTLLFAALGAVSALLWSARLPLWYRPVFHVEEFRKASRDAYFVAVYTDDLDKATHLLVGLGGEHIASIPKGVW